jgi:hypothetical protein
VAEVRVLRGHHFVSVSAPGFEPQSLATTTAFLDAPARPTVVALNPSDFFEEMQGTLEAHVLDRETGEAIPGARVRLEGHGRLLEATSDGEGTARIEDVPFGTWTLSVEAEGYQGRSRGGFEVRFDKPHRKGAMRLQRLEEEIRPASLPKGRLQPSAPEPDPKACGFHALGEWTDRRTAEVVDRAASSTASVGVGATHRVDVPGPGRMRVTLTVSGKHDNSNTRYGSQRFRSKVLLRSEASVAGNDWMAGGEYWSGVRDSDETSDVFPVAGPGPVSLQFVPEACELRKSQEGAPCWYPGASEAPGLKVHPMSYSLKVEFDPCGQE